MTEWLLIVYLFAPAPSPSGYDWKTETKGTYKTEQLCRAAARVEQAKDVPLEGGRVVTCRATSQSR